MKNSTDEIRITHCPTCGSDRIRRVTRDVPGVYKSRAYTAKNVHFEECPVCGERLFDREAMKKLDLARGAATKAKPPRKPAKHRISA
jgi:YgiT-type zinc finger domain-containing protein